MLLLRAFLLWTLMVAVPFQAYAAAAMLRCGSASVEVAQTAPAAHAHPGHAATAAQPAQPDHSAHATQNHPPDHAGAHDHHGSTATHDEPGHSCGTCGTCHAVALIGVMPVLAPAARPPAELGEPAPRVATHTPRVPDKPPRG